MNNLTKAKEALKRVTALREDRKLFGINAIYLHVSDVEGNWLETWSIENES